MRELFLKAAKGQLLIEILMRGRGLVLFPAITRSLGIAEFGWYSLAIAVTGLLSSISAFGLDAALARFLPGQRDAEAEGRVIWPAMAARAVTAAALGGGLAALAGTGVLRIGAVPSSVLVLAGLNVVSIALQTQVLNAFRITLRLSRYYGLTAFAVVVSSVLQVLVIVFQLHAEGLIASLVVADVISAAVGLRLLTREIPWARPTLGTLRPLYRFGLPLAGNSLLNWANNSIDRLFVEAIVGSAALGLYSAGYMIAFSAVSLIATPIFTVLPSIVFRLWDTDEVDRAVAVLSRTSVAFITLSMPVVLSLWAFGGPVVILLAGPDFAGAQDYLLWVALGYVLMYAGDFFGYSLMAARRERVYAVAMVVSVAVNVGGNAILVPRYDALGAALATTLSLFVLATYLTIASIEIGVPRPALREPITVMLLAFVCWTGARALVDVGSSFVRASLFSIATSAIYLAAILALRVVDVRGIRLQRAPTRTE